MDSETIQRQFLETIARAYPDYLINKGKGSKYYIKIVYSSDGKQVVDVGGIHDEFYPSYQQFLTIPTIEFLKMVPKYFSKARHGNYYINHDAILEYEENSQPLFLQVATDSQFQCDIFMVMPFRPHLDPVYQDHIKKVASELNLDIKRGDDPFSHHDIITEIWSLINNCQLVIADCTDKNPNVFYEMGLAHAIGKPVIPITQNKEDIPFDIRQRRFIEYEYTPRGMSEFEDNLKRAIQSILGNA